MKFVYLKYGLKRIQNFQALLLLLFKDGAY